MKSVLGVFFCLAVVLSVDSAFRFALTEAGLNEIKKSVIPEVIEQVRGMKIPEIKGEAKTEIGKIKYDLTELKITEFSIPDSQIKIVPSEGISLAVEGVTGHLTLHWHYKSEGLIPASDSGSADIDIKDCTLSIIIAVGAKNAHPTATVASFSSSIGDLDVHLHGGASWLYNLFVSIFKSQIKKTVVSSLDSQLPPSLDEMANKSLSTFPIISRVDNISEIDYSILEKPLFTTEYLSASTKGEFYYVYNPKECPSPHHDLPLIVDKEMIQAVVDEFLINSASFAYFSGGFFEYFVDDSMIPAGIPYSLNTSDFQIFLPELYKMYPNDLMTVLFSTETYPALKILNGTGIKLDGYALLNVSIVLVDNTSIPVFTIGVDIDGVGYAEVNTSSSTVYGQISKVQTNISLEWSGIGPFSLDALQTLIQVFVDKLGVSIANERLAKGFPLPVVEGLTLIQPEIDYFDGYFAICSDFCYTPPKKGWKIRIN